jgi:hypothetical protein
MVDGFLGRWSQRKIAIKEGKPVEDVVPAAKPADAKDQTPPAAFKSAQAASAATPSGVWGQPQFQAYRAPASEPAVTQPGAQSGSPEDSQRPAPTLADAQTLTPQSDFKPYMSSQVTPEVRNAAMKKLFSDPHFNVMDGLDIYIDDYTQPDPLPLSMMRQMASANFLGLFDDEKKEQKQADLPVAHATSTLPQASQAEGSTTPDDPVHITQAHITQANPTPVDIQPEPKPNANF